MAWNFSLMICCCSRSFSSCISDSFCRSSVILCRSPLTCEVLAWCSSSLWAKVSTSAITCCLADCTASRVPVVYSSRKVATVRIKVSSAAASRFSFCASIFSSNRSSLAAVPLMDVVREPLTCSISAWRSSRNFSAKSRTVSSVFRSASSAVRRSSSSPLACEVCFASDALECRSVSLRCASSDDCKVDVLRSSSFAVLSPEALISDNCLRVDSKLLSVSALSPETKAALSLEASVIKPSTAANFSSMACSCLATDRLRLINPSLICPVSSTPRDLSHSFIAEVSSERTVPSSRVTSPRSLSVRTFMSLPMFARLSDNSILRSFARAI
mmetsp:Transcript_17216/g.37947  ORF Transcript_17216/g.37947 Transcript_17216/m.37947 type:complete len:328 (-) Transcript_17216:745-1728(-)